jgi:[glutamine synthetase] adenylyltransferase / [glutamine synthetase]-adenylyl-L-tyrosine phosphorylase
MFNAECLHLSTAQRQALPRIADPLAAEIGMDHWRERVASLPPDRADQARQFAEAADGQALLAAVFANSPFLGATLTRELPFFLDMIAGGFDATFFTLMQRVGDETQNDASIPVLMSALRTAKRQVSLLIGLADLCSAWPLERVTGGLSDFAEAALRRAVRFLLREAAKAGRIVVPDLDDPERGSGLIALAMGKLGARELNYSSDIDLIIFYDDAVAQIPDGEMSRFFVRLSKDLVRIMEERTADGYVFRTDLRLRPDPAATPLAVSASAAETYYGSLGQNWERAAMIKARQVAGDRQAGAALLDMLGHFVWRRNLDFAAIQDIHSIKRQIGAHKGHREKTVNGHNIKIGRGGIREIEFFVQTQQLIFGGRDRSLRVCGTQAALSALAAAGRADASVTQNLAEAYRFLRRIEHRVQMVDDRQTHALPADDAGVAAIAAFAGYDSDAAFRHALMSVLSTVSDHYARLFEETPNLSGPGNLVFTGADDDPATMESLRALGYDNPSMIAAQVRAWHYGRYRATRSARARELLTELIPALLAAFGRTAQPDQAFLHFDEFLGRLPAGVQLFSLFVAHPSLLELVADVMGTAPRLAQGLARRPAILDAVLMKGFWGAIPSRAALADDFASQVPGGSYFEEWLDQARRWTHEQRFRAGVRMLRYVDDADSLGPYLSDVADIALEGLQHVVETEFAKRHGRLPGGCFALIAMGRLGARSLLLESDLDLIMVYEADATASLSDGPKPLSVNDYFIKLNQRLIAALTASAADGPLYEVDMRLRPSGNAGPLAVSFAAFSRYQRERAWTWEHMALTRARVVTGPPALRQRLAADIQAILTAPRDPDRLLADVLSMRERIERQRRTETIWQTKHVRGGMIDIQFLTQYLCLLHAARYPDLLRPNTVEALTALAERGLLDPNAAHALIAAQRAWRRVQGFVRLTTEGTFDPTKAPLGLKTALARTACPEAEGNFEMAQERLHGLAANAYGWYQALTASDPVARASTKP